MIPHITNELECKAPSGDEKAVVGSLSVQVSASSRGMVPKSLLSAKNCSAPQILCVWLEQTALPCALNSGGGFPVWRRDP